MAKVMAVKPKAKSGKRKVTHIRVEGAANGFTVHHRLEPKMKKSPSGASMPDYGEAPPDPAVFNDHAQAAAHVAGLMQQMAPQGAPPDAAAAAPPEAAA